MIPCHTSETHWIFRNALNFQDLSVNWYLCSTSSLYSSFFHTLYIFLASLSIWFSLTHTNRAANPFCVISIKLPAKLQNFSLPLQAISAPSVSQPSLKFLECTAGRYWKQGTWLCPCIKQCTMLSCTLLIQASLT